MAAKFKGAAQQTHTNTKSDNSKLIKLIRKYMCSNSSIISIGKRRAPTQRSQQDPPSEHFQ